MRLHRHRWVRHERFRPLHVRRCEVCGVVEHKWAFTHWEWTRSGDHLQPKLTGWFRLLPFGLFLEATPPASEV